MLNYPTVKGNLPDYIDAGFPILYIDTYEEAKADEYIKKIAEGSKIKLLEWNGANGFVDFRTKAAPFPIKTLEATLEYLKNGKELNRTWLVIKDASDELKTEPQKSNKVVALLKEIARKIRDGMDSTIIIVSSSVHIPQDLEKMITVLDLGFPDEKEISAIINQFMKTNNISTVNPSLLEEMSSAFKGLSEFEIEDLLRLTATRGNGELTGKALQLIFDQKQQMIMKAGVLEMIPLKESINDIGGLENLKEWLQKKAKVFKNMKKAEAFGVPMPKGVLIAGVPGCGKSLSAKAAGKLFEVPLLRLDMGRLMGRYVGESEGNMRKAIQLAEAISPCVLWVDEMEKAFAGIGGGGGGGEVTTRLFGQFLTWMQDKTGSAFVVATANDITGLPPELLRKGRFDEIFYVALPNPEERKRIFEIHIKRRKQDPGKIDITKLASKTEGYSGADIEGVVGESVESVFVNDKKVLTTDDVLDCISKTNPLAVIMEEELAKMDKEYQKKKLKKASR